VERERETEDRGGVDLRGRSAGDAGPRGAAAGEEREPTQLVLAELLEHRDPGRVQLMGGRRGAPPRHTVRLLDERDAQSRRAGRLRGGDQVRRLDAAARAVAENQRGDRIVDGVKVSPRGPVRGLELEDQASLFHAATAVSCASLCSKPDRWTKRREVSTVGRSGVPSVQPWVRESGHRGRPPATFPQSAAADLLVGPVDTHVAVGVDPRRLVLDDLDWAFLAIAAARFLFCPARRMISLRAAFTFTTRCLRA